MLDAAAQSLQKYWKTISRLEAKRKSKIFSIIHCGPEDDHICGSTFWSLLAHRAKVKGIDTLELLLHSPGGSADIAYTAVKFFRQHCSRFNVIVPLTAKSAATLMCLGADNIYMGELADLGPIDIQIQDPIEKGAKSISPLDEFKSAEFLRDYAVEILDFFTALIVRRSGMSVKEALRESVPFTTGIMRPLYEQLDPLEIGEYKRSLAIGEDYANRLLALTGNPRRKEIVETLVSKYPSHEFVIDAAEAQKIGLPVKVLKPAEETMLLTSLESIVSLGESIYGFPPIQAKKSAKKITSAPVSAPKPTTLVAAR